MLLKSILGLVLILSVGLGYGKAKEPKVELKLAFECPTLDTDPVTDTASCDEIMIQKRDALKKRAEEKVAQCNVDCQKWVTTNKVINPSVECEIVPMSVTCTKLVVPTASRSTASTGARVNAVSASKKCACKYAEPAAAPTAPAVPAAPATPATPAVPVTPKSAPTK